MGDTNWPSRLPTTSFRYFYEGWGTTYGGVPDGLQYYGGDIQGQYTVTLLAGQGGSTVPGAGTYTQFTTEAFTATASPANNTFYEFSHWLRDGVVWATTATVSFTGIEGTTYVLQPVFIRTTTQVFRGATVHAHQAADYWNTGSGYTAADYQRMNRWGFNSITFHMYWTMLEPDASQAGVYQTAFLNRLDTQVALAQSESLYPIIALRGPWDDDGSESWMGWGNTYGWDLINYDQDPGGSGKGGRERFIDAIEMLAARYPACGLSCGFFPYHRSTASDADKTQLYGTTLPAIYTAARAATDEWLILYPNSQGIANSKNSGAFAQLASYGWTPLPTGNGTDTKLILGFNTHDNEYNNIVQNRSDWNYDMDLLDSHYQAAIDFQTTYAGQVACGSAEAFNLNIHGTSDNANERPIDGSRLDWVEASLQLCNREGFHWWYYVYENPPSWASPIESNGADTALADLLSRYAYQDTPEGQYTVTVLAGMGGSTVPGAGLYAYYVSQLFTITAYAAADYTFSHWLKDGANVGSTRTLTFTGASGLAYTVQPVFTSTPGTDETEVPDWRRPNPYVPDPGDPGIDPVSGPRIPSILPDPALPVSDGSLFALMLQRLLHATSLTLEDAVSSLATTTPPRLASLLSNLERARVEYD
jgi:hypothetical protein